ncbi:MAG: hypothetical protein Q9209_005435 [Squamulea sp. 1 TL-2023]
MHFILTALSCLTTITFTNAQSSIASSVLPTLVAPTPTSIGNASDINTYPICAQTCAKELAPFLAQAIPGCDANNIDCACSAYYRSRTAACEEVTCSDVDYQTTQTLAQQLCGPLYSNNSAMSTSIASAIASATAVAASAVAGKDPLILSSYPACALDVSEKFSYEYRVPGSPISVFFVISTSHPIERAAMGRTILTGQTKLRQRLRDQGNDWLMVEDEPYEIDDKRTGKCMIGMRSIHVGGSDGARLTYRGVFDVLQALWDVLYFTRRSNEAVFKVNNGTIHVGNGKIMVGNVSRMLRLAASE